MPKRLWTLLPLIGFAGLAIALYLGLSKDPRRLPSMFDGKPIPAFSIPQLMGAKLDPANPLNKEDLELEQNGVTLVNFWGSWCQACIVEHPFLMALSRHENIKMVGIAFNDKAPQANGFLQRHGNPFDAIGLDQTMRVAIDWGVTGAPETFVIASNGQIAGKLVGPAVCTSLEQTLLPLIEQASGDQGGLTVAKLLPNRCEQEQRARQ